MTGTRTRPHVPLPPLQSRLGAGSEPAFVPDYAAAHGCAWFDLPAEGPREPHRVGGWAARGGEPAARFESWRDLPSSVVWWTNLEQPEAWMLGQWSRFKDGALFGVDWRSLMDEWGQSLGPSDLPDAVRRGSEILARLAFRLSRWCAEHDPENPWSWGQGDVADALSVRGWSSPDSGGPQPILAAAYCDRIAQDVPSVLWTGRRRVHLALPRLDHVRRLWRAPFPTGGWTEVRSGWPARPRDRAAWVAASEAPLLVRVDDVHWRGGPEEELGWLWLGQRGRVFAGATREPIWMTGGEVAHLSEWAELDIEAAWQAGGWTHEPGPRGDWLAEQDPLAIHAPMPGLLAWSAFRAAAGQTRDPARRQKHTATPRAVWWRAAEREMAFAAAAALHRQGVPVAEYGNGRVTVVVDPLVDPSGLARAIRDAGLLVPSVLARTLRRDLDASLDNPVTVGHWVRYHANPELLCDLDRLVAPWPGTLDQVRSVLEASAKRLLALTDDPAEISWKTAWKDLLNQQVRISVDRLKKQARRDR